MAEKATWIFLQTSIWLVYKEGKGMQELIITYHVKIILLHITFSIDASILLFKWWQNKSLFLGFVLYVISYAH